MELTKASAGYVAQNDSDFLCGQCTFKKGSAADGRCAYFAPDVQISYSTGSCNRWKFGDVTVGWLKPYFTKEQLGYVENSVGFGCKRCEYFAVGKNDCSRVQRTSQGFTAGIISTKGCCDLWEPDATRGHMTNQQLVKILERPKVVLHIGAK